MSGSRVWRAGLAAVSFLTVLPVARRTRLDADDVGRGAPLFPLVGAGVGAVMGGVTALLARTVDPTAAAAIGVAAGAGLTGALHLDALADTADGLGGRTRDDALRIMRDHHLGAYGVVALALDLLIKTAALAELAAGHAAPSALIAACALARAAPAPVAWALPYAQPTEGKGRVLSGRTTPVRAAGSLAIGLAVATVAVRWHVLWAAGVGTAVACLFALDARRRLGGVTGDVLGAVSEGCETAILIALAAVIA